MPDGTTTLTSGGPPTIVEHIHRDQLLLRLEREVVRVIARDRA